MTLFRLWMLLRMWTILNERPSASIYAWMAVIWDDGAIMLIVLGSDMAEI